MVVAKLAGAATMIAQMEKPIDDLSDDELREIYAQDEREPHSAFEIFRD